MNELNGTFTIVSRFKNAKEGEYSNGPVKCNNLIDAMAIQLSFLVGTPVEIAKTMLKEESIEEVKKNLLSAGQDRLSNQEEESWILFKPGFKEEKFTKMPVDRYTENYIAWLAEEERLEEVFEVDFLKKACDALFERSKYLPGFCEPIRQHPSADSLYSDKYTLAKIALRLCTGSIYDTEVLANKDTIIYVSKVDNTALLREVLIIDYLVNVSILARNNKDKNIIIQIYFKNEPEKDALFPFLNFLKAFKRVEVKTLKNS